MEMGISGKSKIKKIVAMGLMRPDSTAVNSWAVKMLFKKEISETKLKKRTLIEIGNYKTTSRTFG
jgi:hypothetical protein